MQPFCSSISNFALRLLLLQHSPCFLQGIIWAAESLPILPRQARHHFIPPDALFLLGLGCFLPFSQGKILVFCAILTLKQANENESLSNTAPTFSDHDLMLCNLQNLSIYLQQSLQDGIIQISQLFFFLQLVRESPCFFYLSISSVHYQAQYQANSCFSITNCSR